MAVVGKKVDQTISVPDLGIEIRILPVKELAVNGGIDTPAEFRILHEKIDSVAFKVGQPRRQVFQLPQKGNHRVRNQLNSVSIALHLFKAEVDAGHFQDAETTFGKLISSLQCVSTSQVVSYYDAKAHAPLNSEALLLSDKANEQDMLAGFLRMQGYSIAKVSSDAEALEYLESNEKARLMLIDMGLPGTDAASTIRTIRKTSAMDDLQIYGLSEGSMDEVGLSFQEQRIDGWFMRPLNLGSVVEMLLINNE